MIRTPILSLGIPSNFHHQVSMYHRFRWTPSSRRRNGISQEYEPLQPYFLLALIEKTACKTFVDVGANIGAYSVLMSQACARIEAFEANPAPAGEARANLALNQVNGTVHEIAISDKCGHLTFGTVSRLAGNSAVVETAENQAFRSIQSIPCSTLDQALPNISHPAAIKIDVEGHEMQVISGASRTLSRPCVVQVENYKSAIKIDGYQHIATIGPDHYFSNIPDLNTRTLFEYASAMMIKANHEAKSTSVHVGDFTISVSGRSYERIKSMALRLIGSRL